MKSRSVQIVLERLEDRTLMSTCHVTRLSDGGAGTGFRGDFRYCINKVNTEPGADEIIIHRTGTINLNSALPELASDIDIQGPGANLLTVRRAFEPFTNNPQFRIFNALPGTTVQLSGMTISHGYLSNSFTPNTLGVGILNDGTMTLLGCVVTKNIGLTEVASNGGGIYNRGTMTIIDSSITDNTLDGFVADGGGISNDGNLSIYNSTISRNKAGTTGAGRGSGIYSDGVLTIFNSTVSDNDGPFSDFGEGVHVTGFTVISHSTIAFNGDDVGNSGLFILGSASVFMRNTIVANNGDVDVDGSLTSSGYNLIGDSSEGSGFAPTDILDVDPMLGGLFNYGGPTNTRALLPGSLAIDAGDNADAPEFDQRGPGFPRIVNGTIDIGAFEVQSTPVPSAPKFLAFLITAKPLTDDYETIP